MVYVHDKPLWNKGLNAIDILISKAMNYYDSICQEVHGLYHILLKYHIIACNIMVYLVYGFADFFVPSKMCGLLCTK